MKILRKAQIIALVLGVLVAGAGGFAGVSNLRDDYVDSRYITESDTEIRRDPYKRDDLS